MEEKLSLRERYERQLNELLEKAGLAEEQAKEKTVSGTGADAGKEAANNQEASREEDSLGSELDEVDGKLRSIREKLDPRIQRALDDMGFENLTPIQEQAIPALLTGKDIIGQAQTGTGKTAAFGIPLIARVDPAVQKLQAVVLCPTRELAMQAAEELRKIAKYVEGLRILPVYGGQDIMRQIRALPGVQIIVGTPGRVMDHMNRHTVKLDNVSMVVLDEADEMLNMGFREDMEVILGAIPGEHQTALFSATMPKPILEITKMFQKDAVNVKVAADELTIPLVSQKYFLIKSKDKDAATVRLLEYYQPRLCLIFCNTKMKVEELAEVLKKNDFQAEGLHGDLIQHQRDIVMGRFRNGSTNILIATDVAARGIDVDDVEIVINYDIPKDNEYYVHRIGRTGRAGKTGQSFTFAGARELHRIREIERYCKTTIEEKKLPDASKVLKSKAKKYLDSAWELRENEEDIELMKVYLRRKMEKDDCDIFDLAACMLKQEIGEKGEEILEDVPQPRRSRGGRDGGKRGEGRGEQKAERHGGRSFERDGEGRGEQKAERRGGRSFERDGEGRGEQKAERRGGRSFERNEEGHSEQKAERRGDRSFERREGVFASERRERKDPGEKIFGKKYELLPSRKDLDERSKADFEKRERKSDEVREKEPFSRKEFKEKEPYSRKEAKEKDTARKKEERSFGRRGIAESEWEPRNKKSKKEVFEFWEKPGAVDKHQSKKERKGSGKKEQRGAGAKERKGSGAREGRKSNIDVRTIRDVDQYGRPKKVKNKK